MIRTRAVIQHLSYDTLVTQKVIPDLVTYITGLSVQTKKYPPFVYVTKDFSTFGLIMDYMIRAGLRLSLNQKIDLGTELNLQQFDEAKTIQLVEQISIYETSKNWYEIATATLYLITHIYGSNKYSQVDINKYIPTLVNITKDLVAKWTQYQTYLQGTIKYNTEFISGEVAGHPDIITDIAVLDIKTTASFPKMAKESCLQILTYYAMMKQTLPNIKYVGFVLPMQRELVLLDITFWDTTKYLEIISSEANKLHTDQKVIHINTPQELQAFLGQITNTQPNTNAQTLQNILQQILTPTPKYKIGGHISKGKNIATTLKQFAVQCPDLPCQMFLGNPRTGKKHANTPKQLLAASEIIQQYNIQYYTHAPYVINLCANECDNGDYWQQRYLNEDLTYTVAMGGKGVVVHVGARKHKTEEDALKTMEHMVRTALDYATEDCPLLLETPCGEGTEVCKTIQELGNFFFRFTEAERKKLGVCIDTAHVHAAGYDPIVYLQHWEKYCQTPIKLLHYNDASVQCGSCVDRHAPPGTGYIGKEKLDIVAVWCHERNIPMVRE